MTHPKKLGLAWISVHDLKKAVKYYTETVGLKLKELHEEFGWAELEGSEGGTRLGIAQYQEHDECPLKPGQNAVVSFLVDDLDKTVKDLHKHGATLVGKVEEVPGHVKMQLVRDADGNIFHLCQELSHMPQPAHAKHEHHGCCGGH